MLAECGHCEEIVAAGEQSPYMREPIHMECSIRLMVGSVAHQQGMCGCFKPIGQRMIEPDLPRRELARQAYMYYQETHAVFLYADDFVEIDEDGDFDGESFRPLG